MRLKGPIVTRVFLSEKFTLKRARKGVDEIPRPKRNRQFPVYFADSSTTEEESKEEKVVAIPAIKEEKVVAIPAITEEKVLAIPAIKEIPNNPSVYVISVSIVVPKNLTVLVVIAAVVIIVMFYSIS